MRIIDRYGQQNALPLNVTKQGGATAGSTGKQAPTQAQPVAGEKVTLSAKARELADHAAAADANKVESLRSAIQSGSFKVDMQGIANKIVDGNGG